MNRLVRRLEALHLERSTPTRLASTRIVVLALAALALALPSIALAQQRGPIDPAEMMRRFQNPAAMQKLAEQAEAAERCVAKIDKKKLDALEKRATAASREIESLCAAGKKDEALAKGLALGREMQTDPTIQKLRKCTEGLGEMLQGMPFAEMPGMRDEPEPTEQDICS